MASTELSLECKVQSYSMLLKYNSFADNDLTYYKLQDFVSRLEEERLKIDVFKRELPLCMQLLTNAVETSRRQLQACKTIQAGPTKPVLEEFIPLKNSTLPEDEKLPAAVSDKANWMASVQLWSQENDVSKQQHPPKQDFIKNGGAFLPFNKDQRNSCDRSSLAAAEKAKAEMELFENAENNNKSGSCDEAVNHQQRVEIDKVATVELGSVQTTSTCTTTTSTTQTHRKARRCWSPDLHRRFVNALQMLGGSQVATPKQIRELMKVEGLTNDEVKSHLQKYRLHTRRPSPNLQASGTPSPHLVVLGVGGIWVPSEYAAAAPALYGQSPTSHPASGHFFSTPSPLPQEFYATTTPSPHPHPSFQYPIHLYKGTERKTVESSPESDIRGSGDRSESFEDKSGSSSGGNGDERTGRRSEECEERNIRSEMISLKF